MLVVAGLRGPLDLLGMQGRDYASTEKNKIPQGA